MSNSQINVPLEHLREVIEAWLKARLDEDSYTWISKSSKEIWSGSEDWKFFTVFSKVPRYTGKENISLSEGELKQADNIRPGWKPGQWNFDQLGRTYILLSIANREKEEFLDLLQKTYETSDMGEAEALYKSLAVLPYPNDLKGWAAEGIRTNMTSVFNAVAHQNPYPAEYLEEDAWNQMVLKALFVETPLYLIDGIDKRSNKKLAEMLADYAHERWAADREVSPELWRSVGPFAEGDILEDLQRVLNHPKDIHKQAAVLALSDSPSDKAREMLEDHQNVKKELNENNITWKTIGKRFHT